MATQFNLYFCYAFVALICVSNGSRIASNKEESTKNIIKIFNSQNHDFNSTVEDVMLSDNTDCDCGPNSVECFRTLPDGGRKCKCKDGFAPLLKGKDQYCEKCDCGEFGIACKFDEKDGKKECTCAKGYGPKYEGLNKVVNICAKCDCGSNGVQCRIFEEGKFCECKLGNFTDYFIDKNDRKCKECDCGPQSVYCEFSSSKTKFCKCAEGYSSEKISEDNDDEYCKRCDCGYDGKCDVKVVKNRSVKQCLCNSGFKEYEGKCKKCDCGLHSVSCTFYKYKGTQICGCEEGYAVKESYSWENQYCHRCDCGESALGCSFLFGNRRCTCKEGFTSNDLSGDILNDYCTKDTWLKGWVIGLFVVGGIILLTVGALVARLIVRSRQRR